jgi:ring-1,2-phenylacetyl-CoA epoxidase subunit PaaA
MEFPIRNYAEFVVAQAFLDRAGRFTTWDLELNCSFAPYRRTLKKVNFEEAFHFRHGAMWTQYYFDQNEETKKLVQDAVNWIFPWGYHWYGRPDHLKGHPDQLTYKVRQWSNDTMRAKWLKSATDFAERAGLDVPARFDEEKQDYVIDGMPYPMTFDADKMDWEWEETTWDRAIGNFKKGGPMRPACYERLQREEWGSKLW